MYVHGISIKVYSTTAHLKHSALTLAVPLSKTEAESEIRYDFYILIISTKDILCMFNGYCVMIVKGNVTYQNIPIL